MFLVLLKFSDNKTRAVELLGVHREWIQRELDSKAFLLVGSLLPEGGAILAHGISRQELDARLKEDPFVQQRVVRTEIIEFVPNLADSRLGFLLDGQ